MTKKSSVQVVVVGSLALDTIETPFERRTDLLGGSVSYACAAASLFSRVGMVAVAGDDFPEEHLATYRDLGIDLTGLNQVAGRTFRWSGVYEKDMINRRTLSTELNVFQSFSPELPESYREAPFLLLGNISPELQLHVLSQAKNPALVVADTMDLWINTARKPLMELIGKVNMLTLNDSEARLLTGEQNLRTCAKRILSWGPDYVVIKKGEHGALLVSNGGAFIVPAYPLEEVRDPTGAGDVFAGAFLGVLAGGGSARSRGRRAVGEQAVRKALLYGAVSASFGVEEFSLDRFKTLTRRDVESRLRDLLRMMSIDRS